MPKKASLPKSWEDVIPCDFEKIKPDLRSSTHLDKVSEFIQEEAFISKFLWWIIENNFLHKNKALTIEELQLSAATNHLDSTIDITGQWNRLKEFLNKASDEESEFPLQRAIRSTNLSIIKALLVCGADPNSSNIAGGTALEWFVDYYPRMDIKSSKNRNGTFTYSLNNQSKRAENIFKTLVGFGAQVIRSDNAGSLNVPALNKLLGKVNFSESLFDIDTNPIEYHMEFAAKSKKIIVFDCLLEQIKAEIQQQSTYTVESIQQLLTKIKTNVNRDDLVNKESFINSFTQFKQEVETYLEDKKTEAPNITSFNNATIFHLFSFRPEQIFSFQPEQSPEQSDPQQPREENNKEKTDDDFINFLALFK